MALAILFLAAGCGGRTTPPEPVSPAPAARPVTVAPAPVSPAASPDASVDIPGWQVALRIMDANGDGRVSADEHAAAAARMFAAMDRDGDGRVTVEEMAALRGRPDQLADAGRMLHDVDANADGVLDRDEHAKATRVKFDQFDRNHDGYLSAAELQAADSALVDKP